MLARWIATAALIILGLPVLALGTKTQGPSTASSPVPHGAKADAASAPATPRSEAFTKDYTAACTLLVSKLLGLATWCNEQQLFAQRDKLWHAVIALEPDNLDARKGLRFGRNTDGTWKEPAQHDVKDRNPKALEEFPAKRSAALSTWCDTLFALLEKEHASPALSNEIYDEILSVDPDQEHVHDLRGESKGAEAWVLKESVIAKQRRADIKATIAAAKSDATSKPVDPNDADKKISPTWASTADVCGVRIFSNGDANECNSIGQIVYAACRLFTMLYALPAKLPKGLTVYSFTSTAARDALLASLPQLSDADKKTWMGAAGMGLPNTYSVALWHPDPKRRLDCLSRHLVMHLMQEAWSIDGRQGWVYEGMGLYLSRELCGTRLTWFGLATSGAEAEKRRGRLIAPESNWMNEALQLFEGEKPPDLAELMGKSIEAMGVDDMLAAYALAAFFVEGHPAECAELLRQIGFAEPPATAVKRVLGLTLAELQTRLVRWLKERK